VLGLDPDPARLWPEAVSDLADAAPGGAAEVARIAFGAVPAAERAAAAIAAHCARVIDAAGPACVAVKPQLACFERLGAPGWEALAATVRHAHDAGLLVLADGKRGDIDVSARAYAQALTGTTDSPFGEIEGLGADAFTANPYMGADTLRTLLEGARPARAGVFVLVRTSNPGAADFEDLPLAAGGTVWERVAALVAELGSETSPAAASGAAGPPASSGPSGTAGSPPGAGGLADVGAVVGATAPEHIGRMRELMPRTPFLLPGVGAQGGRVEDLAPAFAPGRAGGLVTASRSIVHAYEQAGGSPAAAARAEAERLRSAAWALAN
jgi:orotidine-5'-phosphate decarboxylase